MTNLLNDAPLISLRVPPRVRLVPPGDPYEGQLAVELAAGYGLVLDDWQADFVRAALATKPDGHLAAPSVGISLARQNGKNGGLEAAELYKLVMQCRRIRHTAHNVETARDSFLRLKAFFEDDNAPELKKLVRLADGKDGIRSTNGQEAIATRCDGKCGKKKCRGGYISFKARSRSSGRGTGYDDLIIDEAQELTDEQNAAILFAISAPPSGNPQMIMLGTPPSPRSDGAPYRRLRDEALVGGDGAAWFEWSPTGVRPLKGDTAGLLELARATNPGLGIRIAEVTVANELKAASYEDFLRERCGDWDTSVAVSAWQMLNEAAWSDATVTEAPAEGLAVFAVKFHPSGDWMAAAAGWRPSQGPVFVECFGVVPVESGVPMLANWLAARKSVPVVIDGASGAEEFKQRLYRAGMSRHQVRLVSTPEAVAAHAGFRQALLEGTVTHPDQPGLTEQARIAVRRNIGNQGGYGWAPSTSTGDVTALDAVTLAYGAAVTMVRRRKTGNSGWKLVIS